MSLDELIRGVNINLEKDKEPALSNISIRRLKREKQSIKEMRKSSQWDKRKPREPGFLKSKWRNIETKEIISYVNSFWLDWPSEIKTETWSFNLATWKSLIT